MPASGPSAMRAASSIAAAAIASITSATAAHCGVCDADRSRCERNVARSSMAVSPAALFGAVPNALRRSAIRHSQRSAVCRISEILLSFEMTKVFLIMGSAMAGRFVRELTLRQLRALAAAAKHRLGYRRGQTTSPDAARGHAADPQPAGACRHAPDPAHRRRHAADRRRPRSARAFRAHRSRDRHPARRRST